MSVKVRGIRGAVTVPENTEEAIFAAAKELMEAIIAANQVDADDVASVLLTMTVDLDAAFPAKAVRSLTGWQWVPLMCARELNVPQALPKCIRVLMHVNTARSQEQMVHVYLGEARGLRPDIAAN